MYSHFRLYGSMEILRGSYFIENTEMISGVHFDPELLREGQSIYEVFRIISATPLFLGKHLERLEQSAARTNHTLTLDRQEISNRIAKLIKTCRIDTGNIKIVIEFPVNQSEALFYAYFIPHYYPLAKEYEQGIDTITFAAERTNPNAKVANLRLNESINRAIKHNSVYEALLLNHNHYLTEGSRSNLFLIKNNTIYTAPITNVLPGITRGYILEICKQQSFPVIEKSIHESQLAEMDALFLTGTSPNVLAIKKVNRLGYNSASHSMVKAIMQAYDQLIENYLISHKDRW